MPDTTIILGRNPVREAIAHRAGSLEKVLLQKGAGGRDLAEIRRLAAEAGIQVQYVPERRLAQMARGLNHQGVAALAAALEYVDVHEMLRSIAPDRDAVLTRKPRVLILDGIQDPFNFGAVLRSAVASGTAGVVVPERNMAPLNAAAIRASAGTAGRIPVARSPDLAAVALELKERGYWIAGADVRGETSVWEMDWDRPIALVIGGEAAGIRQSLLDACDYRVAIPMAGPAESLNASVAAGILLFVASRLASAC